MHRPLSSRARGARLAPFAVAIVAGLGFVFLAGFDSGRQLTANMVAAGIVGVVALAIVFVPWERLPPVLETLPGFGMLAVVLIVVAGSGAESPYAPMIIVPLLWFAVYSGRLALTVAVAATDALLLGDVVFFGAQISSGAVRTALLWTAVATTVPVVVNRIVRDLNRRAALADRDYVTELLSRRAWEERLPEELARARRDDQPISIVLFDLDQFKQYNDLHGHQAGDALLRQIAIAWGRGLRSTDLLARFGGDEYCAALPGCSSADAVMRMERLLADTPGAVQASAGIAEWAAGESVDSLIRRADAALYEAKSRSGASLAVAPRPA